MLCMHANARASMLKTDLQTAGVALSRRYEEQLFTQTSQAKVVPVLLITGFLGSGKTTLVQHLLSTTGSELRLGVLVNEVAALDVDGQLLSTAQSNAAAGIRSAQLSGGCACCSVSGDLQAALHQLAGSSSYTQLDYLLLETSGVADVEPLASLLTSSGFKLAGVVTVVDAEEGGRQLQQEEVALAQLRAADVVVLNKCDLASLSVLSAVEDLIQDKAAGVRMVRARYGQVPPEALLDIDVEDAEGAEDTSSSTAKAQSVQGEIAFLSHEPVVSTSKLRTRAKAGSRIGRQRAAKLAAAAAAAASVNTEDESTPSATHQHPHSHHHSHSSFVSVSFSSSQPLCMACFQVLVTQTLLTAPGLFRAKGFVWFDQLRQLQYVFHVSGKQRAECGATGGWQGPPGVQLVLIGQDQGVLMKLREGLQQCTAGVCGCGPVAAACQGGAYLQQQQQQQQQREERSSSAVSVPLAGEAGGGQDCDNQAQQQQQQQQQQREGIQQQQGKQAVAAGVCSSSSSSNVAAARFAELVQQHHRFELWELPPRLVSQQLAEQPGGAVEQQQQQHESKQQQQQQQKCGVGEAAGLVHFSAMGSALHGVISDEVNASVLRKASATPGLPLMCHIKSPPALRTAAGSSAQVAYQGVQALQLCFRSSDTAEYAEQLWQQLQAALAPVLRKAYQHVHNCKCDVVQLMTAEQ